MLGLLTFCRRCIRQTIDKYVKNENWTQKYNVWYGRKDNSNGQSQHYSTMLMRSVFCLVLPGDGWSARFEDSVLHGCIPVIIQDNTQV
jgi:hypothetical protein